MAEGDGGGKGGMTKEEGGNDGGKGRMAEEEGGNDGGKGRMAEGEGVGVMGWDFVYSTVTRSRMLSTVSIPMPFTSSRASALVKSPFASL